MNRESKTYNWTNLITIFSVILLVSLEIIGLFLALGWALWGLLELGSLAGWTLMGCFILTSLWLCGLFVRQALSVRSSQKAF
jgi:hypothetical protein